MDVGSASGASRNGENRDISRVNLLSMLAHRMGLLETVDSSSKNKNPLRGCEDIALKLMFSYFSVLLGAL